MAQSLIEAVYLLRRHLVDRLLWVCSIDYTINQRTHFLESTWVLTRDKMPSYVTNQLVEEALKEIEQNGGPSASDFKTTSQEGC